MRIWDIPQDRLCRNHLLAEHRELHAIWSVIVNNKKGYSKHPETIRWTGKLRALYKKHEEIVKEMKSRNYNHYSPLDKKYATGKSIQDEYIDPIDKQMILLKNKKCNCKTRK